MTDKEIYQQIEEYSEAANAQYAKIHEQVEASIVKHAQAKKRRKKLFSGILPIAVVLVITLAIVLPIVLQPQDEEVIRYSDADSLLFDTLDNNLKEYYAKNNLSLLYLDWYEYAEELYTARYYEEGNESNTVYLYEEFVDGNTSYGVKLSIMKRNIVVESLDARFGESPTTMSGDIDITYTLKKNLGIAKFEYQGYKYYLQINGEITLDFLNETIKSMFNN